MIAHRVLDHRTASCRMISDAGPTGAPVLHLSQSGPPVRSICRRRDIGAYGSRKRTSANSCKDALSSPDIDPGVDFQKAEICLCFKYADADAMSALPPKADMCSALGDVCFVPIADIGARSASPDFGVFASSHRGLVPRPTHQRA